MKIPQYTSQQNMTLDTPKVEINTQVAGQQGRSMQEMGKGFSALGEHLGKLRDQTESNTQKLTLMKGLDDLETESMKDPDPFTAKDRVEAKAKQLLQTASEGITSPSAKAEFQAEAGLHMQTRLHSINTGIYRRQIDKGKSTMLSLNDRMEQDYYAAPDESTRVQLKTFMKENVHNAVKAGYVDETEAYKYLDKTYSNMRVGQVEYAIANDNATQEAQSQTLADLKAGSKGRYPDLLQDERLDLIKKTQSRIFQNNQTFKRETEISQNERVNGLIDKFSEGTATISDIENELKVPENLGGIPRKTLFQYQKAVEQGITKDLNRMLTEKTQDKDPTQRAKMIKQYNDLIDNFIDDKTDQWKAKEMLATAYTDGIISPKEQKFLSALKAGLSDMDLNRSTSPIAKAVKGIKEFWRGQKTPSDEQLAINIKQLVGGVMSGQKSEEVQQRILSNNVKDRFPDYATYPKEGKLKRDSSGRQYKVFPDGSWAWVEVKKSESK